MKIGWATAVVLNVRRQVMTDVTEMVRINCKCSHQQTIAILLTTYSMLTELHRNDGTKGSISIFRNLDHGKDGSLIFLSLRKPRVPES